MSPYEHAAYSIAGEIWDRVRIQRPLPVICVRDVGRGSWSQRTGVITLPRWLWDTERDDSFRDWYVGHELAHFCLGRPGHDLQFQCMLAWLCPHTWHWECTYKPRAYDRAVRLLNAPLR